MSRRCVVVIPDAGPFNSLWVADRLDLLLTLEMPIVVLDAVYDELTREPERYPKDADVQTFIRQHPAVFTIEPTDIGQRERERRAAGEKPKRNTADVAIADFMSDGVEKYAGDGDPVLVLFEDSDLPRVRFFRKPDNLHLLSTVGMLRGLERVGVIASADAVIQAMTKPADPTKRPRVLADLPDGIDDGAAIGSAWTPSPRRKT